MNRLENRYVCREYIKFVKSCAKYDHVKFIQNLKKNKDLFSLVTQEEGKLNELFNKLV
jgi:hypothetical protein